MRRVLIHFKGSKHRFFKFRRLLHWLFLILLIVISSVSVHKFNVVNKQSAKAQDPLWTFVVMGDTCGEDPAMFEALTSSILTEAKPDMLLHVGDLCYLSDRIPPYFGNKLKQIQFSKSPSIEMFLAVGNHDWPYHNKDITPGLLRYDYRRLMCKGEFITNLDDCINNLSSCKIEKTAPWNKEIINSDICKNINDPRYNAGSQQYAFVRGNIKFVVLNGLFYRCYKIKSDEHRAQCPKYKQEAIDLINKDMGESLTIVLTQNPMLSDWTQPYYYDKQEVYDFRDFFANIKNKNVKLIFSGDIHRYVYSIINLANEETFKDSYNRNCKPYDYPRLSDYVYKPGEIHHITVAGMALTDACEWDYFWVKVFADRLEVYRKLYKGKGTCQPYKTMPGELIPGFTKILTIPGNFVDIIPSPTPTPTLTPTTTRSPSPTPTFTPTPTLTPTKRPTVTPTRRSSKISSSTQKSKQSFATPNSTPNTTTVHIPTLSPTVFYTPTPTSIKTATSTREYLELGEAHRQSVSVTPTTVIDNRNLSSNTVVVTNEIKGFDETNNNSSLSLSQMESDELKKPYDSVITKVGLVIVASLGTGLAVLWFIKNRG